MSSFNKLIGQHLKKYRQNVSLTIEKLAEKDISANHLGRIERGESNTTLTTFMKMPVILKIPSAFYAEIKQLYKDNQP